MQGLPEEFRDRLRSVSKLLVTQRTLPAKLEVIVALAERTVPGCDAAGIVLLVNGEPATAAVSDRLALEIDLVQYQTGEGPCLAAVSTGKVVRIEVLQTDSRFTRFAPGALDREIGSTLSIPLLVGDVVVGALNMYARRANAFGAASEEAAGPLADYAAESIGSSPVYASAVDMVDAIMEAMEDQAVVNQAVGVLIAREGQTSAQAFSRLQELASASGETLGTVARWVLEERPGGPSSGGGS